MDFPGPRWEDVIFLSIRKTPVEYAVPWFVVPGVFGKAKDVLIFSVVLL